MDRRRCGFMLRGDGAPRSGRGGNAPGRRISSLRGGCPMSVAPPRVRARGGQAYRRHQERQGRRSLAHQFNVRATLKPVAPLRETIGVFPR